MKILNCIFGKKKGSAERFFRDYCFALSHVGCEVATLTFKEDSVTDNLPNTVELKTIQNFGKWDPIASWKIKKIISEIKPDVIIVHAQRAVQMFSNLSTDIPVIAVCHNTSIKHILNAHYVMAASNSIKAHLLKSGMSIDSVYTVPNMLYVPSTIVYKEYKVRSNMPTIGVMARFDKKNGLNSFLRAMAILRSRGKKFKVKIAGTGIQADELKALASKIMIDDAITFEGWVYDKDNFLDNLDVLCLPCLSGHTSISMLEGFMHSLPIVATNIDGFKDIATDGENCLIYQAGEPGSLASAIEKLLNNPQLAETIARGGFNTLMNKYDNKTIGQMLYRTIENILGERMSV